MNNIWSSLFDRIFVINLPDRTDRLQSIEDEMKSVSIPEYHRRDGIIINDGETLQDREAGCRQAHLNIIQEAKDLDLNRILIFEDDTAFEDGAGEILEKVHDFIIGTVIDIFYLGANLWKDQYPINGNIVRVNYAVGLHAYIVNKQCYDKLLSYHWIDHSLDMLIAENLQKEGNCYCVRPRICYQKTGYSNIQNKDVNYNNFLRGDIKCS